MKNMSLKTTLERALPDAGFKKHGKLWICEFTDVQILLGFQKVEFGPQVFANVGFWLNQLGGVPPAKIELTHLYYRLERLCPVQREAILAAGDCSDGKGYAELSPDVAAGCLARLKNLGSLDSLKIAFRAGELSHGLIRKEVRALLTT